MGGGVQKRHDACLCVHMRTAPISYRPIRGNLTLAYFTSGMVCFYFLYFFTLSFWSELKIPIEFCFPTFNTTIRYDITLTSVDKLIASIKTQGCAVSTTYLKIRFIWVQRRAQCSTIGRFFYRFPEKKGTFIAQRQYNRRHILSQLSCSDKR